MAATLHATTVIIIEPGSLPSEIDGVADNGEIVVVGLWSSVIGERASWPKIGQEFIQFEPECNGRAKVLLGTGSFFLISGERIDLGF